MESAMSEKARRDKSRSRSKVIAPTVIPMPVPPNLHPMVATKLWNNPCWLSFRANFISHYFNQPIYEWIAKTYGLSTPEHVVLYAVGLSDGITADDVAASSARPKNTLSRAVNSLIARGLLTRVEDATDRRRKHLYLTRKGRQIIDETMPAFVEHEQAMIAVLSLSEQRTLNHLLTKLVLDQSAWPTRIQQE
jgi:MarR family transcriptional regulator, temperature-dependent positive regulator of motility